MMLQKLPSVGEIGAPSVAAIFYAPQGRLRDTKSTRPLIVLARLVPHLALRVAFSRDHVRLDLIADSLRRE